MIEKSIQEMSKDELAVAARAHGVELDLTLPKKDLVVQVANIKKAPVVVKEPEAPKPSLGNGVLYLKHPTNGRVYLANQHLMSRGDMLPCTADGVLLSDA